jgi:hypothetical protein
MRIANLKNLLVACTFLSVIVCPVAGKIIYVNDDAGGANNGTSWQDAYTDLQSALLTSLAGDQIWVAAGTYKPGTFPSHFFRMKNGVETYGGFPDSGDPNMADRDWHVNPTILSGDIGVEGNNTDNCHHVFYHPSGTNLSSSGVLDGFTITAGYSGSFDYGAGMYNEGCSPTISNCTFVGNIAGNGGALYNSSSSPTLINCIFYDNSATAAGGGIYNASNSSPVLTNCTFYNNTATTYGGGIYNNLILFYRATLTNCILWGDTAGTAGNEIYDAGISSNSVVTYSDVDGGWPGIGCIDTDPCFADAASGDFHLLSDSPCIDAGTNTAASLPSTDFEGDARIINGLVDMGVDEVVWYELVCHVDPAAGGTFTLDPAGGYYLPGTVVTVTANAAVGNVFDHWSGDLTGSTNPETITMDSDYSVTAHFNYELSIILAPPAGGTFTLNPPGGVYAPGTLVELDVEPAPDCLGIETDPYRIGTVEQLQFLSESSDHWDPNIYFVLTDDITVPPGFIINPIGNISIAFDGNFDGAGHTISGLFQSGSSYLGLFGVTGSFSKLRNLGAVDAAINGSGDYLGILVGLNYLGTISDCSASGAVTGGVSSYYLGGLAGHNYYGTISNCSASGAVTGISNCNFAGGLVGANYGFISNCYATGVVTGNIMLGGLVGDNYNWIYNCSATGAVTGNSNLGGLVGKNRSFIGNCYASGAVTGATSLDIGGLVGFGWFSTISNCYWDKDTTGQPTSSNGGTGKTTAEMKQQATFAGWDFTDIWLIMESQSYPYQDSIGVTGPIPGDVNGDGVVDFKDVAILCGNWLAGIEP